jgi:hypothetical protein
MIEGLKIQMSAAELAKLIDERIERREAEASECEADLRRPENERRDPLEPEHIIEREMEEHRQRAVVLRILRDHLIAGETYLLDDRDLEFADLVPDVDVPYLKRMRPPVPELSVRTE